MRTLGPWAAIAVAIALFAFETLRLRGYMSSDFIIFYDAAVRSVADFSVIYKDHWAADVVADMATLAGFLYPPPAILAFLPLAFAESAQAFAAFSGLALLAAIAAIWVWLRMLQGAGLVAPTMTERAALIALALVSGPVFACRAGQVDTFILLLCVLGVALGAGRWGWIGGSLLAIGGWIKIYPGLLLFCLPLLKDWRAGAIGFVVAAVAIPLLSLVVIPAEIYVQYFSTLLPAMAGKAIINIDNQSLAAIWLRLQESGLDPRTSFQALPVPAPVNAAIALAAIATAAAFVWRTRAMKNAVLPVSACVMALIAPLAPLGWGHSYAYMLPLLAMVLGMAWERRHYAALLAGLCAWALILIPAHSRLPDAALPDLVAQLFYARYAVAVVVLLAVLWRLIGRKNLLLADSDRQRPMRHPG